MLDSGAHPTEPMATDRPDGSSAPFSPHAEANPGYALGQIARALTTEHEHPDAATRERAGRRVSDWLSVFGGMLSGALQVGSRTPVRDVPAWVTTRVVAGGFVTGELAAGGDLLPHELARLDALGASRQDGRGALNASFLTEAGLADLYAFLASGHYRLDVPEEGALLVVAWLAGNGRAAEARQILDTIGPWFDRLRFYPVPTDEPPPAELTVRLCDVESVREALSNKGTPADILDQREALAVWAPHHDRVVALIAETVQGPMPTLVRAHADGTCIVEGGWPFQSFPDGWTRRAENALEEYRALRAEHTRTGKPDRPDSNPARLRAVLAVAADDPSRLSGRDVGRARTALAQIDARRGLPGSDRLATLRREQTRVAALPSLSDYAAVLADRLRAFGHGLAPDALDGLLAPVNADEAARHGVASGSASGAGSGASLGVFRQALLRATDATPEQHIAWGTLSSAESLARVVPPLAARARSAGLADASLRRLDEALYIAFRRRRSVLLLNLQSQVGLRELPWVKPLDALRADSAATRASARASLQRVVGLALSAFPHQILPNKLLQELRALAKTAGLDIPFVDEIAADIFMGTFTEKYLRAAQAAASRLTGSLYARYYAIDTDALLAIDDVDRAARGAATSPAFARLCAERANVGTPANAWGLSVAQNGAVIEQEQILTTHNLATLFEALDLDSMLDTSALALDGFRWTASTLGALGGPAWGQRRAIKNAAYAWRQVVFFLSTLASEDLATKLAAAEAHLDGQTADTQSRVRPLLRDLASVASDALAPRVGAPFHGWSQSAQERMVAE